MRFIARGGAWKNSEDEILKAAIMKYGLNDWHRVASLLPQKTHDQCKSRWFEWLDPSIKKTEWSREEEERLLHLAKLMPAQWRTIAPLVGRTAVQCQEHYEEMLDRATNGESKIASEGLDREHRPELRPARPDPIDMDEEEKEMLAEARARLANTVGKHERRRVRERMLEEAARLAKLQKARELRMAGISTASRKKDLKHLDLGTEIPQFTPAPAGAFSTVEEDARASQALAEATSDFKMHLANDAEERKGRIDTKRKRQYGKEKLDMLDKKSSLFQQLAAQSGSAGGAESSALPFKRPRLNLPAPVLSAEQVEETAKQALSAHILTDSMRSSIAEGSEGPQLLADGRSVLRRDVAAAGKAGTVVGGSVVSLAAHTQLDTLRGRQERFQSDLAAIRSRNAMSEAAVLSGGADETVSTVEASVLRHKEILGSASQQQSQQRNEFQSVSTIRQANTTLQPALEDDNSLVEDYELDPLLQDNPLDAFPQSLDSTDLDFDDSASVAAAAAAGTGAGRKFSLRGLKSLPKPKNSVPTNVSIPPAIPAPISSSEDSIRSIVDRGTSAHVVDARVAADREKKQQEAQARLRNSLVSAAIQKGLPRPLKAPLPPTVAELMAEYASEPEDADIKSPTGITKREFAIAESLILDEVSAVLSSDAAEFPISHPKAKTPSRAVILEPLSMELRQVAESELLSEMENSAFSETAFPRLSSIAKLLPNAAHDASDVEAVIKTALDSRSDSDFLAEMSLSEMKEYFEGLKNHFISLRNKNSEEAAKLELLTRGYLYRTSALSTKLVEMREEKLNLNNKLKSLQRLGLDETVALPIRQYEAEELLDEVLEREKELQIRYKLAKRVLDDV